MASAKHDVSIAPAEKALGCMMLRSVQIFFYFLVVTSIVVAGQLILGGSAVINALTGLSYIALFCLHPCVMSSECKQEYGPIVICRIKFIMDDLFLHC